MSSPEEEGRRPKHPFISLKPIRELAGMGEYEELRSFTPVFGIPAQNNTNVRALGLEIIGDCFESELTGFISKYELPNDFFQRDAYTLNDLAGVADQWEAFYREIVELIPNYKLGLNDSDLFANIWYMQINKITFPWLERELEQESVAEDEEQKAIRKALKKFVKLSDHVNDPDKIDELVEAAFELFRLAAQHPETGRTAAHDIGNILNLLPHLQTAIAVPQVFEKDQSEGTEAQTQATFALLHLERIIRTLDGTEAKNYRLDHFAAMARGITRFYRFNHPDRSIKFTFDQKLRKESEEAHGIRVKAALPDIHRAIFSCVNNAIKRGDAQEIDVQITEDFDKKAVQVVITDNGSGIKPELLKSYPGRPPLIFRKGASGHGGTGLGLGGVQDQLNLNNADISIANRESKSGARIIISVPVSSTSSTVERISRRIRDASAQDEAA